MRLPPLCVGGFPALALTSPLFGGGFVLGGEAGLEVGGVEVSWEVGEAEGLGRKDGKRVVFWRRL